ncbi:MAG: arylamine N-acetyltransferase family protein [Vicinamibacterales bacterium]
MDVAAYLARITYQGPLAPTAEALRRLQTAHLRAIPFENLSIHTGEPIVLEDEALFEKVVTRRRGGFCYELNGLFASLLRRLGFDVTMLAAEVMNARGEYGPPFDHMALCVTLKDRWLADVGFGDSFLEPLRLDAGAVQTQGDRAYRMDRQGDYFVVMQRIGDAEWRAQYRCLLERHEYADYAEMCRYHQTSPDSPFTRRRICSRATLDGRVTLSGTRLISTEAAGRQERELPDERDYVDALRDHFGIALRST